MCPFNFKVFHTHFSAEGAAVIHVQYTAVRALVTYRALMES